MATNFDSVMADYLPKIAPLPNTLANPVADPSTIPLTDDQLYSVAAARAGDTGQSQPNEMYQDLRTGSVWDILNKYGAAAGPLLGRAAMADTQFRADRNSYTSTEETARNLAGSALLGLTNTVGGIGSLAAGLVNNTAGTWSAEKLQEFNDWMHSKQSPGLNNRRRAYGELTGLDYFENAQKYQDDVDTSGSFVASLRKIGRDAWSAGKRTLEDDALTDDTIGSAAGSLFVGGPLSKVLRGGLGLIARGAVAARPSLLLSEAAGSAFAAGERATMPAAIGLMESGGAYQGTVADAMDNLNTRSDLTDDQKASMANRAGLTAAAIQGPIGVLTGKLVSKFEANPLAPPTVRSMAGNILRETAEEATQGGSGQLAQNYGIKRNVDQTRDLTSGVGEQIALGAIGGGLSAGVVQAPGTILRSAVSAAKLTGRAIGSLGSTAIGSLNARGQAVRDQIDAESPVNTQAMDNAMAAAATVAADPEVRTSTAAAVQNAPGLNQEQKAQGQEYLTKLFDTAKFDPAEADNQVPVIGEAIKGSTDKFDAMRRVASIASNKDTSPADRLAAGLYLVQTIRNSASLIKQVPEAIEKMDDNDPALGQVRDFEDVLINLERHPMVREAIDQAMKHADSIKPDQVANPKVAQTAIQLASIAPEKTNPEVNNQILKHAEQKVINITPVEASYLQAANALHEANARQETGMKQYGLHRGKDQSEIIPVKPRTTAQIVSDEAQQKENNQGDLHLSATSHLTGIMAALDAGNIQLAGTRLKHFVNFAQSMQNKVQALNDALVAGDSSGSKRTPYQAYNPIKGTFFESKPGAYSDPKVGGVFLDGTSRGSIENAQQVSVDADAIGYLANETVKAFPELGVKPIELAKLHAAVSQTNAREAMREYSIAKRDGTLAEHMDLSEKTSPDRAPQTVLDETNKTRQSEQSQTEAVQSQDDAKPAEQSSDQVAKPDQSQPPEQPEPRSQVEPAASEPVAEPAPEEKAAPVEKPVSQEAAAPALEAKADKVIDAPVTPKAKEAPKAPDVSGIDAAYPDLLGSNDDENKNLLKQAFSLPEEPISRLTGQESPVETIRDALTSATRFRAHVGSQTTAENAAARLTGEVAKAYSDYLKFVGPILKSMNDRLAKALKDRASKGKALNLSFEELRALNIAEKTGDVTRYNTELQQNAVIAGLQWLLTADQRQRPMDDEAISKILGVPVTSVTWEQNREFNQGIYLASAVQQLSDMIGRYWGVKADNTADLGVVRGIPEGVAKEIIRSMEAAGLLKVIDIKNNGKIYYQLQMSEASEENPEEFKSFVEQKLGKESFEKLNEFPSAIEIASIVEPEETTFVGAPPSKVAKTQLRNPLVPLTKQQTDMAEAEQATPHYPNLPFIQMLNSLGEDGAVALFAHGELDPELMNANHLKSLESVNLTVRSAIKAIERTMAEVQNWSNANGRVDLDQVPIHYRYEFTSVNRLQMVGKHNPQANKVTREAIMPTRATIDLRNPENYARFMLSMAQAWGVKVHKQTRQVSVRDAERLADGRLKPALDVISDWLGKNTATRSIEFTDEQVKILRDTLGKGGPVAPAALHAAIEYSRFLEGEDNSKFTTSLYVEADGITDGPINAMVHTASGGFTSEWVNIVRKGGLFFGQPGMTANRSDDTVDLYQHTTDALKVRMADLMDRLQSNEPVHDQLNVLLRTMSRLMPELTFNDETNELSLDRGVVKNPLTVSIYGSGAAGIADKISEALMKSIYEMESRKLQVLKSNPKANVAVELFGSESTSIEDAERRYEAYHQDILSLFNNAPEYSEGGLNIAGQQHGTNKSTTKGANNLTFLPSQVKSLKQNVLRLFVKPMREAIAGSIGETEHGTVAIRKATQVQGIYLKYAFQRAVNEALEQKSKSVPGFKKSDFLSQKELQTIYDKLGHLAPYIETGTQNMFISGSEKSDIGNVSFSRDLDGQLSTPAYVYGPSDPGVSGIPYTIIGTGDGQMMQNYATTPGADPRHLLVFDGAHFPIDNALENQSRLMNEAVYRGWMENPLEAVSKSFADFVRDADLTKMGEEQRSALSEALLGPGKKGMETKEIVEEIQALSEDFQDIARQTQARKNALAQVQMTVDHMASAEASYTANLNGESLEGMDDEQVAKRLDELYLEEYSKLEDNKSKSLSENISDDIPEGLAIPSAAMPLFVAKLNVPQAQKSLLAEVAQKLRTSGWSILSGSPRKGVNGENILGQADFGAKEISVFNGSSETLLHEMVHAATLGQVYGHYANPQSLSKTENEAVDRIEALMHDWLDQADQVSDLNQEARRALLNAQTTVMSYLSNTENGTASNKANAVNEFMAWVLANQPLTRVASRTKVQNPIARIVGQALQFLKDLLGLKARVGDDIYSNLRFNTSVLLRTQLSAASSFGDTTLHQSDVFGDNERIAAIERKIFDFTVKHLGEQNHGGIYTGQDEARIQKANIAAQQADAVQASFDAHGFPMDMQQASTFKALVAILATEVEFDPNVMNRVETLYAHIAKTLTPSDFRVNPEVNDPQDEFQANEKYNSILGTHLVEIDLQGRSTLIPAFVALAAVHDDMRRVLAKIDLPKPLQLPNVTTDNILTNFGVNAMDSLDILMSGEGRNKQSVQAAIDKLTDRLSDIAQERRDFATQFMGRTGGVADTLNDKVVNMIQSLTQKGSDKLDSIKGQTTKPWIKKSAEVAQFGLGIFNKDIAEHNAVSVIELANKFIKSQVWHEFVNEFVGRTRENASVYDMIKTSKSANAQIRQQFREHLPEFLGRQFGRPVTDSEWSAMFRGMAKVDLSSLRSGYSVAQIMEMITDPAKMTSEKQAIEQRLQSKTNGAALIAKSNELADYIRTSVAPHNLLRNAHAIERLLNEGLVVSAEVDSSVVQDIDHYVSLLAFDALNQDDRNALSLLAQDTQTKDGLSAMLSFLKGQRTNELDGVTDPDNRTALYNHYKGYVPSIQQGKATGRTLIVANDIEHNNLVGRGFQRLGDYQGARHDVGRQGRMGYYFSPLSGRSVFNQGIVQNIHGTMAGIDPVTGFSSVATTGGRVEDPAEVARLQRLVTATSANVNPNERLMPIFDQDGNVRAYERSVDPNQLTRLGRSTHFANMMGVWAGRQVEEKLAASVNEGLINRLHDIWQDESGELSSRRRQDEFVNLLDPTLKRSDPILYDAVRLIPRDTRKQIKDLFGPNQFWVRRDMVNDAVGYRKASIGDAWTGTTRFSEETTKHIRNVAIGVFGREAYKKLVSSEKIYQNIITDAKVLIVVKSIVVPMANLVNNMYQLSMRGVPILDTVRGMPKKTAEVNAYLRGQNRLMEIEADMRTAEGANDVVATRKLTVEKKSIEDSFLRLSIKPLIDAGEFSSISDVGLGKEEIDFAEGKLNEYMEALTNKLPEGAKTFGKYAIVAKDTAFFKGLQRTVEYGDFLAKAILYDDLTKRQGKSSAEALGTITEEYVNYDRLAGRTRDYLENMGLLWFWNYKIRITKVALSMIRNNPVHAFLTALVPAPPLMGNIGSPINDNFPMEFLRGSLKSSVGLGTLWRSHNLLPLAQLL